MLRLGLVINPLAGVGGAVALKGSDGQELQHLAEERGARPQAQARCEALLGDLSALHAALSRQIQWLTAPGVMGADALKARHWSYEQIDLPIAAGPTTAADTHKAVMALLRADIDLLVFVGGDGTARDVMAVVGERVPVLGIPAGVKMHSGVFAITPRAAAQLIYLLVTGGLVAGVLRDVRDYDDRESKDDAMTVRRYGELRVPEIAGYLQQTKVGGKESEPLVVEEICAHMLVHIPDQRTVVLGPGSTCLAVKQALGCSGTLRGCDVIFADGQTALDVTAAELEELENPLLVVSFTREQGFLFGRGNQQFSAKFLQSLDWPDAVTVIGSRTKLLSLNGRPLRVDTSDPSLDDSLSGLIEVVTGYEDSLLYLVSNT